MVHAGQWVNTSSQILKRFRGKKVTYKQAGFDLMTKVSMKQSRQSGQTVCTVLVDLHPSWSNPDIQQLSSTNLGLWCTSPDKLLWKLQWVTHWLQSDLWWVYSTSYMQSLWNLWLSGFLQSPFLHTINKDKHCKKDLLEQQYLSAATSPQIHIW